MEKSIKILIDEPSLTPSKEFDQIAETVTEIIKKSEPKFTLGIYGEWGTGKSTLMKSIQSKLELDNKKKILTVWFNAWRFEREENFATIALMKTIGYKMAKNEKFENLSQLILRGMKITGKDLFRKAVLETIMTEKGVDEIEKKLTEKMAFLDNLDKDTIYFDGIETISNEFKKIRKLKKNKDYRMVVFIDDLDRCSPKKALEVLESIKIFLDIEGFIYVIGISVETLNRLISYAYKETGIQGKEYIKKIIQVPIKIPKWDKADIEKLIEEQISHNLNNDYNKFVILNASIIAKAVNYNPRQVKRFINNIIIAVETFAINTKKHSINLKEIFFVQVMTYRFPVLVGSFQNESDRTLEKGLKILSNIMFRKEIEEKRKKEGRMTGYAIDRHDTMQLGRKLFDLLNSKESNAENKKEIRLNIISILDAELEKNTSRNRILRTSSMLSKLTREDWKLLSEFRNNFDNKINWTEYKKIIELLDESPYQEDVMNGKTIEKPKIEQ